MLQDTGERVIPDEMKPSNGLLLEHLARYHFCIPYLHGRVLDIASGSGYGTQMIAKAAKKRVSEVIGIDLDDEAVNYANSRYYHPLVRYNQGNATDPILKELYGTFDVIVSFETIEHIEEEARFLENVYKLLKPNGTLILSTPFGKGRGKPCGSPFHIHQLTVEEFKNLFNEYDYKQVEFYFQRGVLIEPEKKGIHYPLGVAVCKK
ncbi:hypothetical protein GCM10008967_11630 [Bacillus carboniphilus]|uniref:Methyltransferase type 11 domain-containing protein n=1 Tax=Bacillus carboniphilus TaxID=86663 RepID=A0ABN0W1J9_9BACI